MQSNMNIVTRRTRARTWREIAIAALGSATLLVGYTTWASLQSPLSSGAQTGTVYSGTGGSVTFAITENRSQSTPANTSQSVTAGLPTGVNPSFGTPGAWTPAAGTGNRTTTLTLNVSASTLPGTYRFNVRSAATGSTTRNTGSSQNVDNNDPLLTIRGTQTITFGPLSNHTFGDVDFSVNATASSGLPVAYAVAGTCSVSGSTIHLTGAGSCAVTASQPGNGVYDAAAAVQQSFAIAKADQAISFTAAPTSKFIGDAPFAINVSATSGLTVTLAAVGDCSVAGYSVTLTAAAPGSCALTASQPGNSNFNAATNAETTFNIIAFNGTELHAVAGSMTLPGGLVLPALGYNTSGGVATQAGGPVLRFSEGQTVSIRLHNDLPAETTALLIPGQSMIPDLVGVPAGSSKVYTFTAKSGTYLYEAGLLANAQHQVAMGLYGAIVVDPTTGGQAYDETATAYNTEAVLVLSEVDPVLNNSADPSAFDMRQYNPKYFLINGKAYPETDAIAAAAGNKLLLRYVNAGVKHHSMGVLGLRQNFVARDAGLLPTLTHNVIAETLAPGQTADAIATVPAVATDGTRFAVYEAGLVSLRNSNQANFGGMMTFVNVGAATPPGGDTQGPAASGVTLTGLALAATVSDVARGDSNITAVEYWVDGGAHLPMAGAFASPTEAVSATLASLLPGSHTVYVRGQDAAGNWGSPGFITYNNDLTGPATSGLTLTPNPSSSSTSGAVALHATADDSATGGSQVMAAEYFIGAPGANGGGLPMVVSPPGATLASIDALVAVAEGNVFNVHSQDAAGNWGAYVSIIAHVVASGPSTTVISISPNPNNGAKPLDSTNLVVRVAASMTSAGSTVAAAEAYIDVLTNGVFPLVPQDGSFNSASEVGRADIPLSTIATLSAGAHTINVRSRDAAGNWGSYAAGTLTIDKTPPTVSSVNRAAASPTSATVLNFTVVFSEAVNGLTAANLSLVGTLPGGTIGAITGSGTTWQVTVNTNGGAGTLGLNLVSSTGITDLAGNAIVAGLPFTGQTYTVLSPPLYFSTAGTATVPGVGGTADDADIYLWNGSGFSRVIDANGTGSLGLPVGANVDGFVRVDATHFYMSFTGQVNVPGIGNVEDEDVVYNNAGTWSLWFDGSANGLGGNGYDLDAISIVGTTLYFSLDSGNIPTGAGGVGDDADIYRWNGGSSYTRIVDASAIGLPGGNSTTGVNVDGFKYVDATHFYMSFSGDTTLPGLGAVQDEDVVYYNAGTWSVYFDGTAKGLTSSNLDVDAFDIP